MTGPRRAAPLQRDEARRVSRPLQVARTDDGHGTPFVPKAMCDDAAVRPLPPTLAARRGRACRRWTTGIAALGCAAMLLVACRRVSSAVPPDAAPAAMQPAAAADAAAAPAPTSPCTIVELAGDGRDRQRIDETLASQGDVLRECYAQLHARRPAAAGVARIQFAIDPNGLAGAALMQTSSVGDVTFSYCLAEALTTIAFADIRTGHAMSQTVVTCEFAVPADHDG